MSAKACKGCQPIKDYKDNEGNIIERFTRYLCFECEKVVFPIPPVSPDYWSDQSWVKYIQMYGIDKEPETIPSTFGLFHKTDKVNEQGEALYRLEDK